MIGNDRGLHACIHLSSGINRRVFHASSTNLRSKNPARLGGHTAQTARPVSSASGTGPYSRESRDAGKLSPCSHTCPRGTATRLADLVMSPRPTASASARVGGTRSPSLPTMRLHTSIFGSYGLLVMTTSPRSNHPNIRDNLSMTTTSPLLSIVGPSTFHNKA